MTATRLPVLLLAGALAVLPAAAGIKYVNKSGDDATADGTPAHPFLTIQAALDAAASGDEIRVGVGTYNECPVMAINDLILVSEESIQSGTNASTIIDATGACAPGDLGGVSLSHLSELRGFTVRGASVSGVYGFGSVRITNNLIRNNSADLGAGVYLYAFPDYPASVTTYVEDNTIDSNTAATEGGGVWVYTQAVSGQSRSYRIEGNTIRNNSASLRGGGILAFSSTGIGGSAAIRITRNTIQGNGTQTAGATYYAGGGGVYASTFGYGTETIEIDNNTISTNDSADIGGGAMAWAQALGDAQHTLDVHDNAFSGNTSVYDGGGADIRLRAVDLSFGNAPSMQVEVAGNTFTGNSTQDPQYFGGGGLLASVETYRTTRTQFGFRLRSNQFVGNTAPVAAGLSMYVVADDENPQVANEFSPTEAAIDSSNNLVANNVAQDPGGGTFGGGLAAFLTAVGDATAQADVDLATVGGNTADLTGGIEISPFTDVGATSGVEGLADFTLSNSIVSSNVGIGVGGPGGANLTTDFAYNDVFGNSGGNFENTLTDPTGTQGNVSVEPDLDPDYFPSECSPTIDAGDPAADYSMEPEPNGRRINMGDLGGTTLAVPALADVDGDAAVDGVDVLRIATSFGTTTGQVGFLDAADLDRNGVVDGDDLSYVAADFGHRCP